MIPVETNEERKAFIKEYKSSIFEGRNQDGERVVIFLDNGEGMDVHTYQSNKWIRVNYYNKDGVMEGETFKGRWKDENRENFLNILKSATTEKEFENIKDNLENAVEVFEKEDVVKLVALKGFGVVKANKVLKKYKEESKKWKNGEKISNKEIIKQDIKEKNESENSEYILGAYSEAIDVLDDKQLDVLLKSIRLGDYTDVSVEVGGEPFVIEVCYVNNEVDLILSRKDSYLEKYGNE